MEREQIESWYDKNKELYQDFTQRMKDLLTTLLKGDGIPFHSVDGRLKAKDSCIEKFERKDYEAPEQLMDMAGLRIITQTTAEVERVCEVIEREFEVDAENSDNKSRGMEVDKVGYLSVHYIVRMDAARAGLSEYKRFEGLCFEIQVRSLLQHAWAEIEHDRNYKFAGKLPPDIQRKFYLIAGTLELMDQEFQSLLHEIEEYAKHVQEETQNGNLDIPVDSTSLLEFLSAFFQDQDAESLGRNYQSRSAELIEELHDFGASSLREVKALLQIKSAAEWAEERGPSASYLGILRGAMIAADAVKYFSDAWKEHWTRTTRKSIDFWRANGADVDALKDIVKFTYSKGDPDPSQAVTLRKVKTASDPK